MTGLFAILVFNFLSPLYILDISPFYKDTYLIHECSAFLTYYLQKEGPTSLDSHVGVRISICEFRGDTNIQSTTDNLWEITTMFIEYLKHIGK
jgi:hypothetical protein